jgi:hypothetical protein
VIRRTAPPDHKAIGGVVLAVVVAALAVGVERAAACSCSNESPRRLLARADAAFVGRLAAKKPLPGYEALYTFRVEQVVKGRLPKTVTVRSGLTGDACGLEVKVGGRTGLLLYRVRRRWQSNLCLQLTPAALRAAAHGRRTASVACDAP